MKELRKYSRLLVPPDIPRIAELTRRAYHHYIRPPRERGIFIDLEPYPILFKKIGTAKTAEEPKQVAVKERYI